MPNSRRRRFSVQKEIRGRDPTKTQNGSPISRPDPNEDAKSLPQNLIGLNASKLKSKYYPNSSKTSSNLEIVAECESTSSEVIDEKLLGTTVVDKNVAASSSAIDLFNILNASNNIPSEYSREILSGVNDSKMKVDKHVHREKTSPVGRDKLPRQHRIKVRSPKRRIVVPEDHTKIERLKKSTGVNPVEWTKESEVQIEIIGDGEEEVEVAQASSHTLDDMCRICHGGDALNQELGQMISACSCRGTVGRVHVKCLERWLTESGKSRCELCGTHYATKRVHRYGVLRALILWILSQNAKQLMVDGLGIMLMSPLAVLAAWLSGRTLAGLMNYETNVTPWPLASTFVLACMTLVCYYCWIVSAATRHALAWWIWYRSQYEVRLQLQGEQED